MIFLFNLLIAKPLVKIQGNKRIETETIKSYIPEQDLNNPEILNETLKTLYELGYFKDVKLTVKNSVLYVDVVEQPIINRIAFEGNKKLKDSDLKKELGIEPKQVFSEYKIVEESAKKIEEMYRYLGYHNAKVTVQSIPIAEGRIDIVFKINEGSKAYIRKIRFLGNKVFSNEKLKSHIESKVYNSFRFWAQDHFFSPEKLDHDYTKLEEFYHNNGYPDASVQMFIGELREDKTGFDLTFSINEGQFYTFGDLTLDYKLKKKINLEKLQRVIPAEKNTKYSRNLVNLIEDYIQAELGRQGVSFANVIVQEKKVHNQIHINILITKGEILKVRHIRVKGNNRTYDRVIRNHLIIHEGDSFNKFKLKESEKRLQELEYFSKVNISLNEIADGFVDLEIFVEEKKTGELNFQVGYGAFEGALAQIGFAERNIGGTGNFIHGSVMFGRKEQELSFGMTDPRFAGRPDLQAGFDVELSRSAWWRNRTQRRAGISLHVSYPLNKYLLQKWQYSTGIDNIKRRDDNDKREKVNRDLLRTLSPATRNRLFLKPDGFFDFESNRLQDIDQDELFTVKGLALTPVEKRTLQDNTKGLPDEDRILVARELLNAPIPNEKRRDNPTRLKIPDTKDPLQEDNAADTFVRNEFIHQKSEQLWEDDVGSHWFSQIQHSLIFVPRSYNPNTKSYFRLEMHNTISGLGGNIKFLRNDFGFKYHYKIYKDLLFSFKANYGFITKFGNKPLRIQDCMPLGGMQVHGFDYNGIGPRDKVTDENVRGTKFYYGSFQVSTPLGKQEEFGVKTGVYLDFGSTHNSKFINNPKFNRNINDGHYLRASIGAFVELHLPMAPLRFDYAIPIRKTKFDREERFLFGIAKEF